MTPNRNTLRSLPRPERQEAVEALVLDHFKKVLLMDEHEELPIDISYFDLGLTSLRLTDIKQRLEDQLDLTIDATLLFNRPTVEQLVHHLVDALSDPVAL